MNYIAVICDKAHDVTQNHTYQLLTKAKQLHAYQNSWVIAICIGHFSVQERMLLHRFGADEILLCGYSVSNRWEFATILEKIILSERCPLVLFSATDWGKTSAAYIAGRLHAGLIADCIDINYERDQYIFKRAALNSSVIADISCVNTTFQMCTVKKNAFREEEINTDYSLRVRTYEYKAEQLPYRIPCLLHSKEVENSRNIFLDKARIVFGFGRGIGNKETFSLLKKVAKQYGAEIAGTRVAVEEGYIQRFRQVGQSGLSIAPTLYIAFGISGASQHMVGLLNAKQIVSINVDPGAPIKHYSDIFIVQDCFTVLKALDSLFS